MRFGLGLIVLVMCLCAAELLVRYAVRAPADEQYDARRDAYAWHPHASVLRTDEGYTRFRMDAHGFNNDPLPDPLPSKRVLVLGDSFVQSVQVMRSDNFITRLNQRFAGQDVIVYNAGLAGGDPSYYPVLYDELDAAVQPQYVVLCLSDNDMTDLLRWAVKRDSEGRIVGFDRQNGMPSQFGLVRGWLYAHSALITHLKYRYDPVIRQWMREKMMWFSGHQITRKHESNMDGVSDSLERWRFVLKYFLQRKLTITVVVMPVMENRARGSLQLKYKGVDRLAEEARQMGIPVLDVNPTLLDDFRLSGLPAKGFNNTVPGVGHLNKRGHRLLGDWLASKFEVITR